jgi:hypothetical protein
MSWYPAPTPIADCLNCGATAHEFCDETCEQTYRLDPRLTDCEDDPCDTY